MAECSDPSKRLAQLIAIARDCHRSDPTLTMTEFTGLVRQVLARRRIDVDVTTFNHAIDRVLHDAEPESVTPAPAVEAPPAVHWDRVAQALATTGLVPTLDLAAIGRRRAQDATHSRQWVEQCGDVLPTYLREDAGTVDDDA